MENRSDIQTPNSDSQSTGWIATRVAAVVLLVVGIAGLAPVHAREVPFAVYQGIDGRQATSVAITDLDRDGDPDLVAAVPFATDEVLWFENTGGDAGSWTAHTVGSTLDGPRKIAAGDLDDDGDVDLAVAAADDDTIAWYENDGLSFTRHDLTTSANGAWSVAIGDLDDDGDADLVYCARDGDEISWLENDGAYNPTFTKRFILWPLPPPNPLFADNPVEVEIVDLNRDGNLDILWASAADDRIGWLRNSGAADPAFAIHYISLDLANQPRDVTSADVDGDGDPDVVSGSADGKLWFFRNTGSGLSWEPVAIAAVFGDVGEVSPRDLDGDSDIDVVAYTPVSSTLAWFENANGEGTSWVRRDLSAAATGADVAVTTDLDRDGDFDVVSAGASPTASLAWHENTTIHRRASFAVEHIISTVPNGPNAIEAGDIDGDGDIDLAVSSFWDKTVRWYENGAGVSSLPGTFDEHSAYTTTGNRYPEAVVLADVNDDGDLDIVTAIDDWVTHYLSAVTWLENEGWAPPTFTARDVSYIADGPVSVAAADIDEDGALDIISTSLYDDSVYWYRNSGGLSPSFTPYTISTLGTDPMSVWPADLANNGIIDVAVGYRGDDTMTWFWNDGADPTPDFSSIEISYEVDGPRSVTAADIDRDGLLDLVCASESGDTVSWLRNDGVSMWASHIIHESSFGVSWVRTVDLDRDGDVDVLGANTGLNYATWYENRGGTIPTWRATALPGYQLEEPRALVPADLDRDGDLDIAVAWYGSDTVSWCENRGGQYTFAFSRTGPASLADGTEDDVLRITLYHDGRDGDTAIEWAKIALSFVGYLGVPLTIPEFDSIFDHVRIYEDTNGSGVFEPSIDTYVLSETSPVLSNGVWSVSLQDGADHWSVGATSEKSFFIVVKLEPDASSQAIPSFRVAHLIDPNGGTPTSRVEDRLHDIELDITRWSGNHASSTVSITSSELFADDFETATVERWSSSVGASP